MESSLKRMFLDYIRPFYKPLPKKNRNNTIANLELNRCNTWDATLFIPELKNTFDTIIADPPFSLKDSENFATYNRDKSFVLKGYNEIPLKEYNQFSYEWIKNCSEYLKKKGVLIIISGWSNQRDILNALYENKFNIINQFIFKYNFGTFTWNSKAVSSHYNIFYCTKIKSKYTFNKLLWYFEDVMEDTLEENEEIPVEIFDIKKEYWRSKRRTSNKLPKELIEMLVAIGSNNKDLVLDLFSGSGTTLKVCSYMDRDCIALDNKSDAVNFANERLTLDY